MNWIAWVLVSWIALTTFARHRVDRQTTHTFDARCRRARRDLQRSRSRRWLALAGVL